MPGKVSFLKNFLIEKPFNAEKKHPPVLWAIILVVRYSSSFRDKYKLV